MPRPINHIIGQPIKHRPPPNHTLLTIPQHRGLPNLLPPNRPNIVLRLNMTHHRISIPTIQHNPNIVIFQRLKQVSAILCFLVGLADLAVAGLPGDGGVYV